MAVTQCTEVSGCGENCLLTFEVTVMCEKGGFSHLDLSRLLLHRDFHTCAKKAIRASRRQL